MKPRLAVGPATLFAALILALGQPAVAQSSCSSDGQPAFQAIRDRFISADCEACWSNPQTAPPSPQAIALDWILPGALGEDAPLSAAARPEGLERMQARQQAASNAATSAPLQTQPKLRVARGPLLSGYVGTSIALLPADTPTEPLTAWLVLVESIPAGEDGTPIPRNLVRNALVLDWGNPGSSRQELRAMSVPEGAKPERLQVVGWVEDAGGYTLAAVQSHCEAEAE
ncbi:MAG: hypothetical protein NTZ15_05550 [Burkholderiales bacterium]|nr:hypothetical protein [Burkholderiales bacterium]